MELAAADQDQYNSCSSSSHEMMGSGGGGGGQFLAEQRQSSIDKEPRTLNINQLDFAREVAEYVVNTRTSEEALQIFTQGLVPVARACRDGKRTSASLALLGDQLDRDPVESWTCSTVARDVASAPF